ncbi:MAG: hypothetical protein HN348_10585 [Proteobacteria bacterium]|nr:hypothetical protein [Pseudomonadota bacterium]
MATWKEVQERIRRDYALDVDSQDEFALTLERRGAAKTREQRAMVRRYVAWGREMLEIRSAFAELGNLDPVTLLQESLKLPVGSIALHGRYLVVVTKVPLTDVSVDGIVFLLTRVAMLADVLEERGGEDRF